MSEEAPQMSFVKFDPTLVYPSKDVVASSYSYSLVPENNGLSEVACTPTVGRKISFDISQTCNLSRFKLQMNGTLPIPGAAGSYHFYHQNKSIFSAMTLRTKGGVYLMDLQSDVNQYLNVVLTKETTSREMEYNDATNMIHASDELKAGNALTNIAPSQTTETNLDAFSNYKGEVYLNSAGDNAVTNLYVSLDLGEIKKTILALDRSIPWNEVITLELTLSPARDVFFLNTDDNPNPNQGVPAQVAVDLTWSNIQLVGCFEKSARVVESLNQEVFGTQEGFSLVYDYPTIVQGVTQSGQANQTVNLRLDQSLGVSLKSIKCVPINSTDDNSGKYDCNNIISENASYNNSRYGRLVTSFHTALDSKRLHDVDIACDQGMDYKIQQKHIRGSSALHNNDEYAYKFHWEDNFMDYMEKDAQGDEDMNLFGGLDLSTPKNYSIRAKMGVVKTVQWYLILHGVKVLSINASGIATS